VGIGLVALFVLDWIVYIIMVSHLRSKANEAFALVPPPRQVIMCDSGPTPACAAKAARIAQSTVAWMPAPTGYQLRWLVAAGGEDRRSLAYEYLVSDSFRLELESDPDPTPPLDYNAHVGATFDIDGTPVSVYVPNDATFPMLTLAWSHEDLEYRLHVCPCRLSIRRLSLPPSSHRSSPTFGTRVRRANGPVQRVRSFAFVTGRHPHRRRTRQGA
jgi:hypothetical protein